ncbi:hypothetical protein F4810DRAFT_577277 [Camillea tinctor]|nr:hypothetical protein F4810DRAFT_577277 [Camillea tinctor]
MAIGVRPLFQHEPALWGIKHSIAYTLDYPELVIDTMSYHYPSLPHSSDAPHSSYISSFPTPTPSSMEDTNDTASKSAGNGGEKKRNRLGYHRASIACSHCRKRKIRCIVPNKRDMQGQCKSCQNLKKDCTYENVDQRSSSVPGQNQGSVRSSSRTRMDSVSVSPTTGPRHPTDLLSHHQSYQQLSARSPVKSEDYPEDHRIQNNTLGIRTFGYSQGWLPTEANPNSTKVAGDIHIPLRDYTHETPAASSFSPYPTQSTQAPATWNTASTGSPLIDVETTSRQEDAWSSYPPPGRVASYGNEASSQYLSSNRPYDRRSQIPSDIYQYPHVATSMQSISHPGTPVDPRASEAVPTSTYGTWQQPYQYSKGSEGYNGWYEGHHHGSPIQEHPPQETGGLYYGR